jgi:hypothetical protein
MRGGAGGGGQGTPWACTPPGTPRSPPPPSRCSRPPTPPPPPAPSNDIQRDTRWVSTKRLEASISFSRVSTKRLEASIRFSSFSTKRLEASISLSWVSTKRLEASISSVPSTDRAFSSSPHTRFVPPTPTPLVSPASHLLVAFRRPDVHILSGRGPRALSYACSSAFRHGACAHPTVYAPAQSVLVQRRPVPDHIADHALHRLLAPGIAAGQAGDDNAVVEQSGS